MDNERKAKRGASDEQYRIAIVSNKMGIVHLRLLPPLGGEIIMAGELYGSKSGARETAENLSAAASRGFKIIEQWEGPEEDKDHGKIDTYADGGMPNGPMQGGEADQEKDQ